LSSFQIEEEKIFRSSTGFSFFQQLSKKNNNCILKKVLLFFQIR
jgi:hypothetical protein